MSDVVVILAILASSVLVALLSRSKDVEAGSALAPPPAADRTEPADPPR